MIASFSSDILDGIAWLENNCTSVQLLLPHTFFTVNYTFHFLWGTVAKLHLSTLSLLSDVVDDRKSSWKFLQLHHQKNTGWWNPSSYHTNHHLSSLLLQFKGASIFWRGNQGQRIKALQINTDKGPFCFFLFMMGCTIIGCSVRFYQLSWYIPDSLEFFGHWWSAILALTKGQKISNWKLLSLNTTKMLKSERARRWNKWQLHITMNLPVLWAGRQDWLE